MLHVEPHLLHWSQQATALQESQARYRQLEPRTATATLDGAGSAAGDSGLLGSWNCRPHLNRSLFLQLLSPP